MAAREPPETTAMMDLVPGRATAAVAAAAAVA
eukprot:CAMPEP_0182913470 /NCGR_PEP_ID=MMETSP0034_2-20130328/38060_1 /TAXON_ID=156128 /ORGANISM="Nephroselmis pyriformis, Strain CCMP717" /LENGTH=31 /DNA_ID= /DNA_START= /DNA_END= /DNA_ORIENTATION=